MYVNNFSYFCSENQVITKKTIIMHNFFAKIQKPSEMAKLNLTFAGEIGTDKSAALPGNRGGRAICGS